MLKYLKMGYHELDILLIFLWLRKSFIYTAYIYVFKMAEC